MKKPNKIYHQKLDIKQENVVKLQVLLQSVDVNGAVKLILECLIEEDSLKQASLLKKISITINKLVTSGDDGQFMTCLSVLAEMFVVVDYKNPARRTLTSLFDNLPVSVQSTAQHCLIVAVLEKLEEKVEEISVTGCNLRPTVDMVSSLMENFQLGNLVVKATGPQVMECLSVYLQHLVHNARSSSNLVNQTVVMNDCLAVTKTIMAVLQKSCRKTTKEVSKDTLPACGINQLEAVAKELVTILNSEFLPDCQTASAMALCLIICLSSQQPVSHVILETIFPHHLITQQTTEQDWIFGLMVKRAWQAPSSYVHLCLCHGALTMVPLEDLIAPLQGPEVRLQGWVSSKPTHFPTLLFDIIFPDLCHLCESLKEPYSCLMAFRVLTLWAEQARQAVALDKAPEYLAAYVLGSSTIPQKLLTLVWDHWDHPIEIVRYQTKAVFEHVVRMHISVCHQEPAVDGFLLGLIERLVNVGWHNRGVYGPLGCVVSITGATFLLEKYPNIPGQVLEVLKDRITGPHAIDFVAAISKNHKEEILSAGQDMSKWLTTWILPLINLFHNQGSVQDGVLIEQSLSKLLKCYPESLQFIVQNLQDKQEKNTEVLITCLKTARNLGLVKVNDYEGVSTEEGDTWGGVVPVDWLKKALCHVQEQTRLDALGLLCDSPRTTEPISVTDVALLKVFLPLNMNSQSSSFRQQCSTQLKKLLLRMKESLRISAKRVDKSQGDHLDLLRLKSCQEFLHWFSTFLFSSLFPGASFARRTTALHLLKLLSSIYVDHEGPKREPFVFNDVMSPSNVTVLENCLRDTYDVNKVLAYELLASCPDNILPFQNPDMLQDWLQRIDCLLSSPKAIDSSTASTTLHLLVDKCSLGLYLKTKKQDVSASFSSGSLRVEDQAFRVMDHLLDLLGSQRAVAEVSLNQAALHAPMHGLLYCLRAMLCHVSISQFSTNPSWQHLVSRLLNECLHVADLASPVVTSSSPEGHMIEEDIVSDINTGGCNSAIFSASSQILLVCCWRTMKEVALLLGDLVETTPIRDPTGLLTPQQVHRIGKFFTTVLLTSKHHGAFELAYNGFIKVCSVLWTCEEDSLRVLPRQWLDALMSDIAECVPTEVLCGTRRSAGVPYFVQAIVTTEPQASGRASFKRLMTELLSVARQPIDKQIPKDSTLPQVHARNILRALFRDTRLGEDVFPFVADGVKVAIRGFLSDSWAVRNSSTLLFSALMTRIFGVKKSKDEHSKRNCMNGREFFTRFPELHPFLLEQLTQAAETIEKCAALDLHPSLYPVLVLLSRLYPSTLDGADSTLSMAAFVPYVIRCGSSSVLKTRAMAARAIVPLVTGETMLTTLQELIESLPTRSSSVQQNRMHGVLLQVHHITLEHLVQSTPAQNIKELVTSTILPVLEPFLWIGSRSNPCDVTRAVFLDIALNLARSLDFKIQDDLKTLLHLKHTITQIALQELMTKDDPRPLVPIGQTLVKEACARVLLCTVNPNLAGDVTPENDEEWLPRQHVPISHCETVHRLLGCGDYEVRLITLEHLNTMLSRWLRTKERNGESTKEEDDHRFLNSENLKHLAAVLLELAVEKENHLDCLAQVYQVLSLAAEFLSFPQTFSSGRTVSLVQCWQHVLQVCKPSEQRDDVKCALLGFIETMADRVYEALLCPADTVAKTATLDSLRVFSSLLKSSSHEVKSVDVRLQTAEVLSSDKITRLLWDPRRVLGDFPLDLWTVVVNLLQDDDSCVRESAARTTVMADLNATGLESSSSVPQLVLTRVVCGVFHHFYSRQPRATLQWLLGWITKCDTVQNSKENKPGSSDHLSDMDVLFDKNSLNSYQEKITMSQSVAQCLRASKWPISQTEPGDVIDEPNDVIDDVTRSALLRLEQVQKGVLEDIDNLFMVVHCHIEVLVVSGILRDVTKRRGPFRSPHTQPRFSMLSISSEQDGGQNIASRVKELYFRLSRDMKLKDVVSHPLIIDCLQEFCEVYGVASFLPQTHDRLFTPDP